jgi:c-di-GMP-binding flagellar brake protein YcgR
MSQNRRAHDRFEAEVAAEIEVAGEVYEGETRDVSMGGVKVLVSASVDEGSPVVLTLILTHDGIEAPDEDPFETEATVMWAVPTDTGGAMLGLRFVDVAASQAKRLSRFLAAVGG